MDQPEILTKRLILRPFLSEDAEEISRLAGNIKIAQTTLNIPHPYSPDMARSWIATHRPGWEQKTNIAFAITHSETGQLLGAIGLQDIATTQAELGYWVGEPYWCNGYCSEAAQAVIHFSFKKLSLNKIIAQHLTSNPASGRVMEKAKMKKVNTILDKDRYGSLASVALYEIENT